jgi:hypothetical protein
MRCLQDGSGMETCSPTSDVKILLEPVKQGGRVLPVPLHVLDKLWSIATRIFREQSATVTHQEPWE